MSIASFSPTLRKEREGWGTRPSMSFNLNLNGAGQNQDTVSGLDDFIFREFSASLQGQWISLTRQPGRPG